jgi:hypothetical protein
MDNKYYNQINEALLSYENFKPYHDKTIDWICDRIDWTWKWKKNTQEQMEELANRVTSILER